MPLNLAIIVVALPLLMFLFLGLVGVKMGRKITGVIGVLAMLVDTVLAYGVALTYFFGSGQGQMVDGVRQAVVVANPAWLSFTDTLVVRMGVLVDPIAAMMLVVITTVSLMVHLYSLGYMSDHDGNAEKGFQRYYAFLALFTFSMLGLVVATNIFQTRAPSTSTSWSSAPRCQVAWRRPRVPSALPAALPSWAARSWHGR